MLCFIILRNIFSIGAKNAPLRTEFPDIKLKGQYTIRVLLTYQFAYRVPKRFEKTRSRMVYHAIKGVWGCFPNKRRDGNSWPSAHCLRFTIMISEIIACNQHNGPIMPRLLS